MNKPKGLICSYSFEPEGICCKNISFDVQIPDNKIYNIEFKGGCNGNLKAISMLLDGMEAKEISKMFCGHLCGNKNTSCMDQFASFIKEIILEEEL